MATLLFMMLPEKGHLNASLKIAKALKARGHRVVYTSLSDFEDYLVSQGLEFIPLFQPVAPKGFITDCQVSVSPLDAVTKLLYLKGLKEKRTAHEYLEEEINRIREQAWPDSIILDAYLALRIARLVARLTTPCLLLNPTVRFPVDLNIPDHNSPAFDRLLELPTLFLCPEEFDLPAPEDISLDPAPAGAHQADEPRGLLPRGRRRRPLEVEPRQGEAGLGPLRRPIARHVDAVDQNGAGSALQCARGDPKGGRLAGAVGP